MAVYRQQVEERHHDLVNLLTQQMTTILNSMMADHKSKFERLAKQVERIARIVDYEEGERHDSRGNNEDRDVSLCPWCNVVFDAEAAAIFEKERMKKELAHREEQA
ncbi:hypothetical protein Ahy_B01g051922 [Arachis hypogaea]|uniref:Uncharacterized protein n=1 Tax=Arachis hypogaea TaxID=3818 RepID=A0A445AN49_ARAHY|nr:hypothetical protein Ahy_B01g051922 [Arachis hypogaea]